MFGILSGMDVFAPKLSPVVLRLPLFFHPVAAGFPSPAEDYIEQSLDLNAYLIAHPAATFIVRAAGDSMRDAGIHNGDLLIVDRSIAATPGRVVIASINGELLVKRLAQDKAGQFLQSSNPRFPPIRLSDEQDVRIWGVVAFNIHRQ